MGKLDMREKALIGREEAVAVKEAGVKDKIEKLRQIAG
jgi:hypothetical protein